LSSGNLPLRAWLWLASATDNLEEKRRYLAEALAFLVVALFLVACGPTPTPAPKTVPVATRFVATIELEQPTGNTVILFGKVIDSVTREEIPFVQVMVESNRGKLRFDSPFTFSFPTMSSAFRLTASLTLNPASAMTLISACSLLACVRSSADFATFSIAPTSEASRMSRGDSCLTLGL